MVIITFSTPLHGVTKLKKFAFEDEAEEKFISLCIDHGLSEDEADEALLDKKAELEDMDGVFNLQIFY
jgi:hypothetical protein